MSEIDFNVSMQEDGWYLASPVHEDMGGATEAPDYTSLKDRVREAVKFLLRDGYHEELGLPRDPLIRLVYSELLFENPESEEILIAGTLENGRYRAKSSTLDIHHENLKGLKERLVQEIRRQDLTDRHIKFRLEEVIQS